MEEKEISLKELFNVIWKGKYLIGICAIALFFIAAVGSFIYDKTNSQVGTIVTMQWSGISQGEYPDGSRFEYAETIEPYVITLAIADLDYDLQTNDVRNAITLTPIVPSSVTAMIQTALEDGEQITYFPSDYKLVLDNGSLNISIEEARDLINEIVDQYRLDFERKFVKQMTVLDFAGEFDFTEDLDPSPTGELYYDYIDASDILSAQITAIENVMLSKATEEFYSPTLGITFNDILVRTNLLKRIELEQINTRTSTYLLTRDKEYLITNYEYKIEVAQLDLNKATAKELEAQDLVDNYQGSVNTILIPGLENQDITVDVYYDTLMDNLVGLQNEIADLSKNIDYYELLIGRLDGSDSSFDVTPQQQAEEKVKVEIHINNADKELEEIVFQSNTLLVEYNDYITSNIIKPLMAPEYQPSVSTLLISAVGLVLGAGIGAVVVLFKHDWE